VGLYITGLDNHLLQKHSLLQSNPHCRYVCCCLCLWGEAMSLNCGHQRIIVHPPGDTWAWREQRRNNIDRGTPDSSTRSLWQSYQHNHLVAYQEELAMNFALRSISFIFRMYFLHAVKSYDMGPMALLHLRRKVCCGFLSSLKIHCPRPGLNLRTLGQWQAR
jgi:hypothetical protein